MADLRPHQKEAIGKMHNGCILHGGVGSGKTHAVFGYYEEKVVPEVGPIDIIVITTARKRDDLDWEETAMEFGIFTNPEFSRYGTLKVDSWNNIKKYTEVKNAFFVFDEQRLVGSGAWVRAFFKIAKKNQWVLLSATPGDTWMDYSPVFVANGFYDNLTDFKRKHVLYAPFVKFPMIEGYINERKLELLRNHLLVEMPYDRHTNRTMNWLDVDYDKEVFDDVWRRRWNIFTDEPMRDIGELYRVSRRITNTDPSRLVWVRLLMKKHPRLIVFYNFDYELEILRELHADTNVYEYNGHYHHPVPQEDNWVYLVQYLAGAEAWNCITTDAIVFYSLTYSYKNFEQSLGRIDRMDTPFIDLFYYMLVSNSNVDRKIRLALDNKEDFNERKDAREEGISFDPLDPQGRAILRI